MWNETLNFVIHTPELALVRFVVEDYDKASRNDFVGQFTLPFTCIQAGEPKHKAWKPPELQLTAVFLMGSPGATFGFFVITQTLLVSVFYL